LETVSRACKFQILSTSAKFVSIYRSYNRHHSKKSEFQSGTDIYPIPCDAVYSTVCPDVPAVSSRQVPGFRPGKIIPENILINYVGPQHVQDATIEAILKHTLPQALSSVMNSLSYVGKHL
jgi:hypothetical protein